MKRYLNLNLLTLLLLAFVCGCGPKQSDVKFARVENGQFVIGENTPYYFVGTNFWYGSILASTAEGGDRERLAKELDYMQSLGINNLRILVGSEGNYGVSSKVVPILQTAPGEYDDRMLDGLDYLMAELGKRNMYAVLFLTNAWEWSGGYSQYLEWSGRGDYPVPGEKGWNTFIEYVTQYHSVDSQDSCKIMFFNHVKNIVSRTNRYTGKPYSEDPAIFSWQIANEPRAFSDANKEVFAEWIGETARLIKSLDPNHMVSTGSEGEVGCEGDIQLWKRIHAYPEVDYTNIHIWPYNWRWITKDSVVEKAPVAVANAKDYIDRHVALAKELGKPVVIEEFGYPRDGFVFTPGSPTTARDTYYTSIFEQLQESAAKGGLLAGCNFWGWGGYAVPAGTHTNWQVGDDYCGDPAQEEQGLNSVFVVDSSTLALIKNTNQNLAEILKVKAAKPGEQTKYGLLSLLNKAANNGEFLFGQQDFPFYGFTWTGDADRSDVKDVCGDYPAVLGCDLGHIELDSARNLDGVPFDRMRNEIIAQNKRGGIVTLSWHLNNPVTGGDSWDVTCDTVVRAVLPGGSQHEKFLGWLDRVAAFMTSLTSEDGKQIPVIFRPWHEHTGSWFWWGERLCSTDEYKALWRMTIERLREKGVTEMVTAYSPSGGLMNYMERYPGDEWIDILGVDNYHGGGAEQAETFVKNLGQALSDMSGWAAARGKVIAVTETGAETVPMANWWTEVLVPAVKDYPVAYALVWRNAYSKTKENHFYGPYAGQVSAEDFVKFYEMPQTIFANDMIQLKK